MSNPFAEFGAPTLSSDVVTQPGATEPARVKPANPFAEFGAPELSSDIKGRQEVEPEKSRRQAVAQGEPEEGPGLLENSARGFANRAGDLLGQLGVKAGKTAESLASANAFAQQMLGKATGAEENSNLTKTQETIQEGLETGAIGLRKSGEALVEENFDYAPTWTSERIKERFKADDPVGTAQAVGGFIVETGITSIADMAAMLASPPAYLTSITEQFATDHAKNDGRDEPTLVDYNYGLGTAAIVSALEKIGVDAAILKGVPKETLRQIGAGMWRAFKRESATEFAQEVTEDVGTTLGTETGVDPLRALERGAFGALAGGPTGATVAGVTGITRRALDKGDDPNDPDPVIEEFQKELEAEGVLQGRKEDTETPEGKQLELPLGEPGPPKPPGLQRPLRPREVEEEVRKLEETPVEPLGEITKDPLETEEELYRIQEAENQAVQEILRLSREPLESLPEPRPISMTPAEGVVEQRRTLDSNQTAMTRQLLQTPDNTALKKAGTDPEIRARILESIFVALNNKPVERELATAVASIKKLVQLGKVGYAYAEAQELVTNYNSDQAKDILGAISDTVDPDAFVKNIEKLEPGKAQIMAFGGEGSFTFLKDSDFAQGKNTQRADDARTLRRMKALTDTFLQTYLPGTSVILTTARRSTDHLAVDHLGATGYSLVQNKDGTTQKVHTIYVDPEQIKSFAKAAGVSYDAALTEVMHHELGHVLSFEQFQRAGRHVQLALLNDYRKWLRERRWRERKTTFTASWRAPIWHEHIRLNADPNSQARSLTEAAPNYWYSFNEFIAEGVARSMSRQGLSTSPLASEFYKALWAKLQDVYKRLIERTPELEKTFPSIDAWLDSLKYRNQRLRLEMNNPGKLSKTLGSASIVALEEDGAKATANRISNAASLPPNSHSRRVLEQTLAHVPRFNAFMKQIMTIPQLEREFANLPGMKRTVDGIRRWWAAKGQWTSRAMDTLEYAHKRIEKNKQKLKAFERFAIMMTLKSDQLERRLTPEEAQELAEKVGLSREGEEVWQRMQADFTATLNKLFEVLEKDAIRALGPKDPVALGLRLAQLRKQKADMLNRDYFPLMRFGRFYTKITAARPVVVDGKEFKTGEIVYFGLNESKREANKEWEWAQNKFSGDDFMRHAPGELEEQDGGMLGMPDIILQKMVEMGMEEIQALKPEMTADELSKYRQRLSVGLSELQLEYSPGSAFKKRLVRRKGTPGFSMDAIRSYAAFMQNFANFIARAEHRHEILDGIREMREVSHGVEAAGLDADKLRSLDALRKYMAEHYEYLMTPENEWANARSAATIWYLGFVGRSAFVNLTQVPLATQPYLASRFSEAASVRELGRAMRDLVGAWTKGKKGRPMEPDLVEALEQGYKDEFLNESLASELGGYSEGSNLQRMLPGWVPGAKSKGVNYQIRQWQQYSMALFQGAERLNRLFSFTAGYRLQRDKLLDGRKLTDLDPTEAARLKRQAFEFARETVETTQGEYARWARWNIGKGKKSIIFLFKMYMQHMAYLVLRDQSRWKFLRNSAILGGVLGIPFMQNTIDIAQMIAQAMSDDDERVNFKKDLREIVEEVTEVLDVSPDLVLRGAGHYGFGFLYPFDLHSSLTLGTIVPGTELATRVGRDNPYASAGRMLEEAGGPVASIFFNMWRAAASTEANEWKRWERTMPVALRGVSKAVRVAVEGEEMNSYNMATLKAYDFQDPLSYVDLAGMTLGFTPRDISMKQEALWNTKQTKQWYDARRATLMQQYFVAHMAQDREAIKDVDEAIANYNKTKPLEVPGIRARDLRQSYKGRYIRMLREEMGLGPSRSADALYLKEMEAYPNVEWEEPSR